VAGTTLWSSTETNRSPRGTLFQGVGSSPVRSKPLCKRRWVRPRVTTYVLFINVLNSGWWADALPPFQNKSESLKLKVDGRSCCGCNSKHGAFHKMRSQFDSQAGATASCTKWMVCLVPYDFYDVWGYCPLWQSDFDKYFSVSPKIGRIWWVDYLAEEQCKRFCTSSSAAG